MRLKPNTIAVELAAHGLYSTSLTTVDRLAGTSRRQLATFIAEAYGGGCGPASTASYWRQFSRAVLAVVYGGLVEPVDPYAPPPEVDRRCWHCGEVVGNPAAHASCGEVAR